MFLMNAVCHVHVEQFTTPTPKGLAQNNNCSCVFPCITPNRREVAAVHKNAYINES